jgi:hypothetical protein
MAILRGVENGFSEIRTARQGRLTISDCYGKIINEAEEELQEDIRQTEFAELRKTFNDAAARSSKQAEAMKKYGGELDAISRDYSAIDGLGNWGIITKKPSETLGAIKSLQSKFAERNDLENFAQRIMSKNKLSPGIAYNLAFPVSANKPLNNALQSAPKVELPPGHIGKQGEPVFKEHIIKKTQTLAEKLGPLLGKNGSPLSVGQELKAKGYDPQTWMNYLRKNRKSLDLTESQARQLDKAIPSTPSLNDLWLLNFTGLDKLEALE